MTIAEEAKWRIDKQSEKGLNKYGHLLDSANLNEVELVEHFIQEATDMLQYGVALKRLLVIRRKLEETEQSGFSDKKSPWETLGEIEAKLEIGDASEDLDHYMNQMEQRDTVYRQFNDARD